MTASLELDELSAIKEVPTDESEHLMEDVNVQIKANLISQFGLDQLMGEFKTGGGVDTIHNVRNGVYSSDEVKKELTEKTAGYNKKIKGELHSKDTFKKINSELRVKQKNGDLVDVYTGKELRRNQKSDLDHVISTKEIYEDKGRVLADKSANEMANTKENLYLIDRGINRSMRERNKTDYADNLENKKEIWRKELSTLDSANGLTAEEKQSRRQNTEHRLEADAEAIKQTDQAARKSYNHELNEYYHSKKFVNATFKNSTKQGLQQAEKQIIGVILVQVEGALFRVVKHTIQAWNTYATMRARFDDFISQAKIELQKIKSRVGEIKDAALAGASGGFLSAVGNTIINTLVTTTGNFAKILCNSFTSLVQAVKVLSTHVHTIPFSKRLQQATKLVAAAVASSVGLIVADSLAKVIATDIPILAPIADALAAAVVAILMGVITALMVYAVSNFKQIVTKVKDDFNSFMVGLTVSPATIKANYERAIAHIDDLYEELLTNIYERYAETERLQQLAYDLDLPTADQFVASADLAAEVGVKEDKILRSHSDVRDYFNS